MLGLKNFEYRRHKEILENFFKLAEIGKIPPGNTPGHGDGWGIGYYKNGEAVVRKSGGSISEEKEYFFETCARIGYSKIILAHFRKSAWPETSTANHAHPFSYKDILFAHNGTIHDYQTLLEEIAAAEQPRPGALDSEVYFHYVMSFASLSLEKAFKKAVQNIKKKNSYSSLTCLFSDGGRLYAYREYSNNPAYYSLHYAAIGNASIISSEPISPAVPWKILRRGKLFVF